MTWKQPVPIDIRKNENIDSISRLIFYEILTLARSEDYVCDFVHGNKYFSIPLKKGQCIFRVAEFVRGTPLGRKKVSNSLSKISKWYTELDIVGKPFGFIITIKNYDELISMNTERDSGGTAVGQRWDSGGTALIRNKIDKIGKNVEKSPDARAREASHSREGNEHPAGEPGQDQAPASIAPTAQPPHSANPPANETATKDEREIAACFQALGFDRWQGYIGWLRELASDYPDRDLIANAKAWRDHFEEKHPKNHKNSFRNWIMQTFAIKKNESTSEHGSNPTYAAIRKESMRIAREARLKRQSS